MTRMTTMTKKVHATMSLMAFVLSASSAFASTSEQSQPDAFVRYVEADAGQWVDLGVVGKTGMKYEFGFLCNEYSSEGGNKAVLLGAGLSKYNANYEPFQCYYGFRHCCGSWSAQKLDNVNRYYDVSVSVGSGVHTTKAASAYYEHNPETIDCVDTDGHGIDTTRNVFLFANHTGEDESGAAQIEYPMHAQIYYLRVYTGSADAWTLVRDFRPCVKGGRAGLYDAVSETIFYSGSGTDLKAATVWTVYPETTGGMTGAQQITNAFTQANAGDEIVFKPGTYVFADETMHSEGAQTERIYATQANLLVRGETTTPRKTWTHGAEPVVLDANGARLIRVSAANQQSTVTQPRFENLTFTGANVTGGSSGGDYVYRGGALSAVSAYSRILPVFVTNCVFRDNRAWTAAAGYYGRYADCYFTNNVATGGNYGGALNVNADLVGCDFVGNAAYDFGPAAVYSEGGSLVDCTFVNNEGIKTADGSWVKPAVHLKPQSVSGVCPEIRHCTFVGNRATAQGDYAGVLYASVPYSVVTDAAYVATVVTNCTFTDNICSNSNGYPIGGAAVVEITSLPSDVSRSQFRGALVFRDCSFLRNRGCFMGGIVNATAYNCTFEDNASIYRDTYGYIYGGDAMNCDLYDCDLTGGEIYDSSLTRCTIHDVTNRWVVGIKHDNEHLALTNCLIRNCRTRTAAKDADAVFTGSGTDSSAEFVNCTFVANYDRIFANARNVTAINCAFFDNTNNYGHASALSWDYEGPGASSHNETVTFMNCYYGTSLDLGDLYGTGNVCTDTPRFQRAGNVYGEPVWAPRRSSPLVGAGVLLDWTADDTDLAGRPRLRDGKVDVGCYQGWSMPRGAFMLFR